MQRLEVLPQSYLADGKVTEQAGAGHHPAAGQGPAGRGAARRQRLELARRALPGPLHPVLDWAADRALASLGRNEVFAVRGDVDAPTVLLLGTLTNRRGQVVAAVLADRRVPRSRTTRLSAWSTPHALGRRRAGRARLARSAGRTRAPVAGIDALQRADRRPRSHRRGRRCGTSSTPPQTRRRPPGRATGRSGSSAWDEEADALIQRSDLQPAAASACSRNGSWSQAMNPDRQLVRPLLVVVAGRRRAVVSASDAILVGEGWISEHYFTTDATSQSFQAQGARAPQGVGRRGRRAAAPRRGAGSPRPRQQPGGRRWPRSASSTDGDRTVDGGRRTAPLEAIYETAARRPRA